MGIEVQVVRLECCRCTCNAIICWRCGEQVYRKSDAVGFGRRWWHWSCFSCIVCTVGASQRKANFGQPLTMYIRHHSKHPSISIAQVIHTRMACLLKKCRFATDAQRSQLGRASWDTVLCLGIHQKFLQISASIAKSG